MKNLLMGLVGYSGKFWKCCGHSISYRDSVLLAELYSAIESSCQFLKLEPDGAVKIQQGRRWNRGLKSDKIWTYMIITIFEPIIL
jgi:hypothetical protein